MDKKAYELLRNIILETATKLQDGSDLETSQEWFDMADELRRTVSLTGYEADRLYKLGK
jgi:hypothetical protein